MNLSRRIACEVRRLIEFRRMSQAELARAVGVSQPAICRFLKTGSVSLPTLDRVCGALGVDLVFVKTTNENELSFPDKECHGENVSEGRLIEAANKPESGTRSAAKA